MRDETGVFNIKIVLRDLFGCQLSLVGDGLRCEGVDVESTLRTKHGGYFFFCHFAHAEKFAFKVSKR